jgi:5-methylcytosine-specific restriction endonuclease McrBC regulatory subunit McrC
MKLSTTDNNVNNPLIFDRKQDFDNLSKIANQAIGNFKENDYPNLLVFPKTWQQGVKQKDGSPLICTLYQQGDGKYKLMTGNVMGFIGVDNTELNITSRFYNGENDLFLHYMLAKVFNINVVNLDLPKGNHNYYDFLPYLFPASLDKALAQGLYKQYIRNQYNDANVKGSIDVNRHIRNNMPFAGRLAYNTREHSYDNNLTQLVRHTVENLRTRSLGHTILNSSDDVRQNVAKIEFATPTFKMSNLYKILNANKQTVNHPYFTNYKDLQLFCRKILLKEKISFNNQNDKVHGILFDGAWLWEEYIAKVFTEYKSDIIHKTSPDRLFHDGQGIIPDFITYENKKKNAAFIGDTKYKHVDAKDNREDYYQIITYMYRYSCKMGYLIFPYDKDNQGEYKRERIIADGKERGKEKSMIVEWGVKIPQGELEFSEFKEQMREAEEKLKWYTELGDILK